MRSINQLSPSGGRKLSPLEAIAFGLLAGAVGTIAMDLTLYARHRRGGGESGFMRWEFSADVISWEQAPAPAQVGKRLYEGMFRRELPDHRAALVNNVTHWVFGIVSGVQYGVLAGSLRRPRVLYGAPFGAGVWAAGYTVLPAAGLYRPVWEYSAPVLAKDLGAHLVYGVATAGAFQLCRASRNLK